MSKIKILPGWKPNLNLENDIPLKSVLVLTSLISVSFIIFKIYTKKITIIHICDQ